MNDMDLKTFKEFREANPDTARAWKARHLVWARAIVNEAPQSAEGMFLGTAMSMADLEFFRKMRKTLSVGEVNHTNFVIHPFQNPGTAIRAFVYSVKHPEWPRGGPDGNPKRWIWLPATDLARDDYIENVLMDDLGGFLGKVLPTVKAGGFAATIARSFQRAPLPGGLCAVEEREVLPIWPNSTPAPHEPEPRRDPTISLMISLGIAVTRANYIHLVDPGADPDDYPAEMEAEFPAEVRESGEDED
jgi:hypothetical protein